MRSEKHSSGQPTVCQECGGDGAGGLHEDDCSQNSSGQPTSCDCDDKSQCWEPCGDLGHDAEHAKLSSGQPAASAEVAHGLLQQFFDALDDALSKERASPWTGHKGEKFRARILAWDRVKKLRGQLLAAPVAQEPVAWLRNERGTSSGLATFDPLVLLSEPVDGAFRASYQPLYAAPVAQEPVAEYTSEMGEAAQTYLDGFKHAHALPVQFRWGDLWKTMCAAAPVAAQAQPSGNAGELPTELDDLKLAYVSACEERDHLRAALAAQPSAQDREDAEADPPWDDCKVAYGVEDSDAIWAARDAGALPLPVGWSLNGTDGAGARMVAVFRVDGVPTQRDGATVRDRLSAIDAVRAAKGE